MNLSVVRTGAISTGMIVVRIRAISTGSVIGTISTGSVIARAISTGSVAVVVDFFPEKTGAGLLEDVIEACHLSPKVDDVEDSIPVV